jgi:hypothetical protein
MAANFPHFFRNSRRSSSPDVAGSALAGGDLSFSISTAPLGCEGFSFLAPKEKLARFRVEAEIHRKRAPSEVVVDERLNYASPSQAPALLGDFVPEKVPLRHPR